jgi:hypothetical protein
MSPGPRSVMCASTFSFVASAFATIVTACGGPSYSYSRSSPAPTDLVPAVAVRDETFVMALTNGTTSPVYLDWSSARFVDVSGLERPLRLLSEENVGTPNVPLDPGAVLVYQLEPAQFYAPPDRRWARRSSLRELITYPDLYDAAPSPRQVTVRVGYCIGQPCPVSSTCCDSTIARQTLEVVLEVTPEGR